ncbi:MULTISPECIES: (deoxy)nucleoside triphosphate pyrophosphohydrolase [Glutamicibacter]|jgi:8-oxo-dGTP diphosphatase|uniref:8-oxo-dGTP diphosphatase n=2 Tax=Glutamicibacter arilaitensis TaxID=256701 RepID=A0A2N7S5S2_9MICC|nr:MULTISPECIES: NUDIX domain-containing protein [Glutamicibacter]PMQ21457.1 NUDIX domain-containing protein [Glutamicibacter arilaitensis]TFH55213.1 NUDIX domain-containing protein [Glutamicibacter arilaitensis]CBT75339.1 NUDIX domain-containing protein [Glutamicibacter arilaitensis Re117]HCH48705.1 NUDIX domain-containing protein [Glutamicibacter sp.]HCM93414.1 NUDIX domain-containing protein [Glutamicibacter sp.]
MPAELKQIVAVAIVDDLAQPTKLLAARRNRPEALAGLWEFPGGKVEPGESEVEAVRRELREELGVQLRLGAPIPGPHPQGWQLNEKAAMRMWFAQITDGEPATLDGHDQLSWLELDDQVGEVVDWIPADAPIVAACLAQARSGSQQ